MLFNFRGIFHKIYTFIQHSQIIPKLITKSIKFLNTFQGSKKFTTFKLLLLVDNTVFFVFILSAFLISFKVTVDFIDFIVGISTFYYFLSFSMCGYLSNRSFIFYLYMLSIYNFSVISNPVSLQFNEGSVSKENLFTTLVQLVQILGRTISEIVLNFKLGNIFLECVETLQD